MNDDEDETDKRRINIKKNRNAAAQVRARR